MEILIGIASWSFVALFLSTWFILPGWVANGAKKEELKRRPDDDRAALCFFVLRLYAR